MRGLNIFSKSSYLFFPSNLHYYQRLVPKLMNISVQWFQKMTLNTAIRLNHRKPPLMVSILFPHIT